MNIMILLLQYQLDTYPCIQTTTDSDFSWALTQLSVKTTRAIISPKHDDVCYQIIISYFSSFTNIIWIAFLELY